MTRGVLGMLSAVALVVALGALTFRPARVDAQHRSSGVVRCPSFTRPDRTGHFLAREDMTPPLPVDGDDLLALVDRSPRWVLPASYAPRDLLDVRTMRPTPAWQCVPPAHQCLRREAAEALRRMMSAMRAVGYEPWLDSGFRGYGVQCDVFASWAYDDSRGFCAAALASALPGHSQHQLGTAMDMFTTTWAHSGPRFREGFGCTPGGRWMAEHAWEYGFVLPYPLHPDYRAAGSDCLARGALGGALDPRTGYKYEPWHVRYIGPTNAAAFHAAWLASGPGTGAEITLEQWLRARAGLPDPIEPATCDGCACAGCATFHVPARGVPRGPCEAEALQLGADGNPLAPAGPPVLREAWIERGAEPGARVVVVVEVPGNTVTQTPIVGASSGVRYAPAASIDQLVVTPGGVSRAYPPLPGAWRIGVGLERGAGYPWRAALVREGREAAINGLNARVPASAGRVEVTLAIEGVPAGANVRVALLRDAEVRDARAATPRP